MLSNFLCTFFFSSLVVLVSRVWLHCGLSESCWAIVDDAVIDRSWARVDHADGGDGVLGHQVSRLLELGCGVGVKVCCRHCGVEACKLWLVGVFTCALLADLTSVLETHVGAQREDNESEDSDSDSKSHHSWVNIRCNSRGATSANLRRELAHLQIVASVHDESD